MSLLASIIAALVPISFYLFLIWKLDKYEPEPIKKVIRHFLWGAFGAVIITYIASSILIENLGNTVKEIPEYFTAIAVAPFIEELSKGIILLFSVKRNYFDDMTDGIVYGGAIGLGFGMTENILYFSTYSENFLGWLSLVIVRNIFSVTMHAIATATFGAMLGKAKFSPSPVKKTLYPIIGLLLAISFHTTWNLIVTANFTFSIGIIFMLALFISFGLVYRFSLRTEKRIIFNELQEEIDIIGFPREHISIASTSKKFRRNWINNRIRKKYITFATKLAFRKFQIKNSDKDTEFYSEEIDFYRNELKQLIDSHKLDS